MYDDEIFFILNFLAMVFSGIMVWMIHINKRAGRSIIAMYIMLVLIILNDLGTIMLHPSFQNPGGQFRNYGTTNIWDYVKYFYYITFPYFVTIFLFLYLGSEFYQSYRKIFILQTILEVIAVATFIYYGMNLHFNILYMGYDVNMTGTVINTYHIVSMSIWSFLLYYLLKKRRIHTTPKGEVLQFIYGTSSYVAVMLYTIYIDMLYDKVGPIATTDVIGIIPGILFTFSLLSHKEIHIKPKLEKTMNTEMKTHLEAGKMYMILGDDTKGGNVFMDIVFHNYSGLVITRRNPKAVQEEMHLLKTPILTMNPSGSANTVSPTDLALILKAITEYILASKNAVILIEDISYIFANNDMEDVVNGLENLANIISTNESFLIIEKDFLTKDEKLSLLKVGVKIVTA